MKKEICYKKKYVAFIDVLGFGDLLHSKTANDIFDVVSILLKEKDENYDAKRSNKSSIGTEISLFSDSLIISYPEKSDVTGKDNLFYLIIDLIFIQFDLAFKDIFIRGGIVKGDLFHERDICFGQALVDAEKLEKSAVYPRIILSEEVLKTAIMNNVNFDKKYSPYNTFDSEAKDYYHVLKKDIDGMWYINYFLQAEEFDDGDSYITMLEKIKAKCDDVLNNCKDDHIKMKYFWLKNKLIETINDKNLRIPIFDNEEIVYYNERLKSLLK